MNTSTNSPEEEKEEEPKRGWELMKLRFDGESLVRGWDGVLEKTREKMEEARAKSLELTEEARAKSRELASSATKLGDSLAARVKEAVAKGEQAGDDEETGGLLQDESPSEPTQWWTQLVSVEGLASRIGDGSREVVGQMNTLGKKMGDGSRDVGTNLVGFGKKIGQGSKDLASKVSGSIADTRECGLTRPQRFRWYVILLFASTAFFGLAFQTILLPTKFAMAFACGTVCSLAAKAMLNGPYTQLRLMCQLRKLPYTIALLATTFTTMYLCFTHATIILIIVSSAAQIAALLHYLFADTPGGKHGIRILFKLILNTGRLIVKPCLYALE
ncbi:hypothetical protein CTAYLR_007155 [Chrysophaeum taylorii]|uniref:Vesicle transport protein n=1 Tax=Chrysophaeum taylorii TaxID=2483200 RepID=A0AAD7XSW7_9STRA|nr:hypothetical protein CTAYLR_007155 [Chrysophaeum taylorii]